MFIFISHLTVPAPEGPLLGRHFRERSHLVDGFPGFLYLQLLRPENGHATYTFLTAWRDRAAFRAYMSSAEHAASQAREPAGLMARSQVRHEAYEVLIDSRSGQDWVAEGPAEHMAGAAARRGLGTP